MTLPRGTSWSTASAAIDAAHLRVALRRDAVRACMAIGAVLLFAASVLGVVLDFGLDYPLKALLAYAAGTVLLWRALDGVSHPHARFGAANCITLSRLAIGTLLVALLGEAVPRAPLASTAVGWSLIAVATLTAVLDAIDGKLARRAGLASRFGARFDMETDAAYTMVLCLLVWQSGQVGAWVLASGSMRYVFVAAAHRWPWLNAPLPPARRRQAVCVAQITVLIVCLGPIVPQALASALAATALALLSWSFAVDVCFLARLRGASPRSSS